MIKAHISHRFDFTAKEVVLYEKINGEIYVYRWDRSVKSWERSRLCGENEAVPADFEPTFVLPGDVGPAIMQALIDAFGKEGIVSERHEGARAKLGAVEAHLHDVQELLEFEKNRQLRMEENGSAPLNLLKETAFQYIEELKRQLSQKDDTIKRSEQSRNAHQMECVALNREIADVRREKEDVARRLELLNVDRRKLEAEIAKIKQRMERLKK